MSLFCRPRHLPRLFTMFHRLRRQELTLFISQLGRCCKNSHSDRQEIDPLGLPSAGRRATIPGVQSHCLPVIRLPYGARLRISSQREAVRAGPAFAAHDDLGRIIRSAAFDIHHPSHLGPLPRQSGVRAHARLSPGWRGTRGKNDPNQPKTRHHILRERWTSMYMRSHHAHNAEGLSPLRRCAELPQSPQSEGGCRIMSAYG